MSNDLDEAQQQPDHQAAPDNLYCDPDKLAALSRDEAIGAAAHAIRSAANLQAQNKELARRLFRIWGVVGVLALTLGALFYTWLSFFPKQRVIATLDNRAVCALSPQDAAQINPVMLGEFAKEAVLDSNTYDYVNFRESINRAASRYYTEEGRKAYLASLDESGNLERVRKNRMTLRAMATNVPQIEEEGMRGAMRYWIVEVPILIEFYSGGDSQPKARQAFRADITLLQQPLSALNIKGVAVEATFLTPMVTRN